MFEWDRSHDWVVQRYHSDRAELTVLFEVGRPSVRELAALRRCLPAIRDIPPSAARARSGHQGRLELGEMPGPEARRLLCELRRVGLRAELRVTSTVSYLPLDRTTGTALIVENDADATRLAEQMIQAGIPVQEIAE
jgi:hypothetical protein